VTGVLFIIAIIAAIAAYVYLKSGETIRFETSSTPRQVTMGAVGLIATKRRWQTIGQGDGAVNFVYQKGANKLIALIGLICFVAPGIVYLVLAGKKEALAVNTDDSTVGMTVVQASSNGWRGKSAGRALRGQFGLAPGSLAQTGQGLRQGSVGSLEPTPASASGTLDPAPAASLLDAAPETPLPIDGVHPELESATEQLDH
jgi:hypothetical protein